MSFLKSLIEKSKKNPQKIVFADALDVRVLQAARRLDEEGLAKPILLGGPIAMRDFAARNGIRTAGLKIQQPLHDKSFEKYAKLFYERRKSKGLTLFEARQQMRIPLYYGAMLLSQDLADVCIAGNLSLTADVLRAAIQVIGTADGFNTVSSFFLMLSADSDRKFAFADGAVIPNPSVNQLADIALMTADSFQKLTGEAARVAMLSFSTKGSADHEMVDKVRQATELCHQKNPHLLIDGELQFDAAFVPAVAMKKAPKSPVGGKANVFIFPSLNAANIGYKIAERIGGFKALGPFSQGLRKPMHYLSRGCSAEDIMNVALTAAGM